MTRIKRLANATVWMSLSAALIITAILCVPGCAIDVGGQRVPAYRFDADPDDFVTPDDVATLHYYGVGGWGIKWRGRYLLLAPYFSNHGLVDLFGENDANLDAVTRGIHNTPFADAGLILVGHGHVDHAADIPAYSRAGLPPGQAGLIANTTTLNMLAKLARPGSQFRCTEAPLQNGKPLTDCTLDGFRITALASDHAPNIRYFGRPFTFSDGTLDEPIETPPARPADYLAGETWAYLIDLLDEDGDVALRIHYMDAVADSDHSGIPTELVDEQNVDIHIACVPGYNYVKDYPEWVMQQGNTGYALLGHWEDFFRSRERRLRPVRVVLSENRLNEFSERIALSGSQSAIPISPLNKTADDCPPEGDQCGPHGENWALPVPGETYQFRSTRSR